jgi:hypothetical protein
VFSTFESLQLHISVCIESLKTIPSQRFPMKDSVIIKDVDCHEAHDTTDPNTPRKESVAVPDDVTMSVAPVMFDEELSYAEDDNGDDDYDDDDDGEDTKKFPTPVSKHSHARSEETDLEV